MQQIYHLFVLSDDKAFLNRCFDFESFGDEFLISSVRQTKPSCCIYFRLNRGGVSSCLVHHLPFHQAEWDGIKSPLPKETSGGSWSARREKSYPSTALFAEVGVHGGKKSCPLPSHQAEVEGSEGKNLATPPPYSRKLRGREGKNLATPPPYSAEWDGIKSPLPKETLGGSWGAWREKILPLHRPIRRSGTA